MQVKSIADCRIVQVEHSAILSTFIKLQFVIKIFILSIFEWQFYTGFTVAVKGKMLCHRLEHLRPTDKSAKLIFTIKACVVGTQNNCLSETILITCSTQSVNIDGLWI